MTTRDEIDFLDEVNSKYAAAERELDQKLKKISLDEQKLKVIQDSKESRNKKSELPKACISLEQAKKRNTELIKTLEMSKARLRSRATYSPIEAILEKSITNYLKEYALIPSTKKSYGPTFV